MLRARARARRVLILCGLLAACAEEPTPPQPAPSNGDGGDASAQTARALGLEPWHADFPFAVELSPRMGGRWYDRSPRQALAQIVANLQGNCSRAAWEFACMFFERAPAAAVDLLAEAAEQSFTAQGLAPYLENIANALGRMGDEAAVPTLLRLLDHPNTAVASHAVTAMMTCGTPEVLAEVESRLHRVTVRAQCDWLRAVARRAPAMVEDVFRRRLQQPQLLAGVVQAILEEVVKLPPDVAVRIVAPLAEPNASPPDIAASAAAILHKNGDRRGTARLRELLRGDNPKLKAEAVKALAQRDLETVLDDVLALSIDDDAEVRLAVAQAIAPLPGDNIDETLTVLGADVSAEVRRSALRALAVRGKRYHLDQLIERVRTASGSNLSLALQDISASGDPTALAAIYERYKVVPADEKRNYMQALAYSRVPAVFPYLAEIFLGEEMVLAASGTTTMSNSALLMANIEGAMPLVIDLFRKVPGEDYRRRAHLLRTVASIAGFSDDEAVRQEGAKLLRSIVFDRSEIPQMRFFALYHWRRYTTIDDAMALKAALAEEAEPMRWALSDWLHEFY